MGLLSPGILMAIAASLLLSAGGGYVYGCTQGEADLVKLESEWQSRWEKREGELVADRKSFEAMAKAVVSQAEEKIAEKEREHAKAVAAIDDRYAGIVKRLRDQAPRAAGGGALKPAAAAPQACGDFEADRTRLPDEDRAVLVGIAAEADKVVERYNLCAVYADELERYIRTIASFDAPP